MTREEIKIEGMSCGHCVAAVRDVLEGIEGIDVESVEIGSARVRVDAGRTSPETIDEAIRGAGYEPVSHEGQ